MLTSWIRLQNKKIYAYSQNKRILRIFLDGESYLYGDYELDIFLTPKPTLYTLDDISQKVISISGGWIKNIKIENGIEVDLEINYNTLDKIIREFGFISEKSIKKMFPKKENRKVLKAKIYRKDGNFIMISCETTRFIYVMCFATS
jgi:hypothetical protein